jgi:hypothetical protein
MRNGYIVLMNGRLDSHLLEHVELRRMAISGATGLLDLDRLYRLNLLTATAA